EAGLTKGSVPIAEKDVSALLEPVDYIGRIRQIGLERDKVTPPIAVAVSEGEKPRMVIFGDTEFISNAGLLMDRFDNNYAMFVSAIEWMAEREFVGPQPKVSATYAMDPKVADESNRIHLLPMWVMFL